MICPGLSDLYYVEWFVLFWIIFTTLSDLYCAEWFLLRWVICTMLNDLNYVAWFEQRWIICSTALNYLYYVEWFLFRWKICTTLNGFLLLCKICENQNDLYSVERFALRRMIRILMDDLYITPWYNVESIWATFRHELLSIGFLMSLRCAYSTKYGKIFYTNLWAEFLLVWKYQEEVFSALSQKLVI